MTGLIFRGLAANDQTDQALPEWYGQHQHTHQITIREERTHGPQYETPHPVGGRHNQPTPFWRQTDANAVNRRSTHRWETGCWFIPTPEKSHFKRQRHGQCHQSDFSVRLKLETRQKDQKFTSTSFQRRPPLLAPPYPSQSNPNFSVSSQWPAQCFPQHFQSIQIRPRS